MCLLGSVDSEGTLCAGYIISLKIGSACAFLMTALFCSWSVALVSLSVKSVRVSMGCVMFLVNVRIISQIMINRIKLDTKIIQIKNVL